jgi:uncharacterized protein
MRITFDERKRAVTLAERGLDFAMANEVFTGRTLTLVDDRRDYGEVRLQTYGFLGGRLVMVVWTEREGARHVLSMRKCNEREQAKVREQLG